MDGICRRKERHKHTANVRGSPLKRPLAAKRPRLRCSMDVHGAAVDDDDDARRFQALGLGLANISPIMLQCHY